MVEITHRLHCRAALFLMQKTKEDKIQYFKISNLKNIYIITLTLVRSLTAVTPDWGM